MTLNQQLQEISKWNFCLISCTAQVLVQQQKTIFFIFYFFNGCHPIVFQHRGICIYANNTTKLLKYQLYFS